MRKKILSIALCFCMWCSACYAETIYLKNGKKVQGKIIEQTDEEVKIKAFGVTLTYYSDEIDRIDGAASRNTSNKLQKPQYSDLKRAKQPSGHQQNNTFLSSKNKKELILDYIEVSGTKDNMVRNLESSISQASPDDAQKIRDLFDIDEIIIQLMPVFDQYFTAQELEELIAFYRSSVGRKLLMVNPLIGEDSARATSQYFQKKLSN